jgi:hypothetical protein
MQKVTYAGLNLKLRQFMWRRSQRGIHLDWYLAARKWKWLRPRVLLVGRPLAYVFRQGVEVASVGFRVCPQLFRVGYSRRPAHFKREVLGIYLQHIQFLNLGLSARFGALYNFTISCKFRWRFLECPQYSYQVIFNSFPQVKSSRKIS